MKSFSLILLAGLMTINLLSIASAYSIPTSSRGFVVHNTIGSSPTLLSSERSSPSLRSSTTDGELESYFLTPKLADYTKAFRAVADEKFRYQQLLFLAAKCPPMDASLKVDDNLVPGCLSTVHVHATSNPDGSVKLEGDSDSQLTKGLLALLINGLSGNKPEDILKVKVEFLQYAGIAKSLTPGRNNGLLNMFQLIRTKTMKLQEGSTEESPVETAPVVASASPVYASIVKKLSMLQPQTLKVEDESYKHAGHAGTKELNSESGETHFQVDIVAECFAGLNLVKRHQMIYKLLSQEISGGVHALSIRAKTPEEA